MPGSDLTILKPIPTLEFKPIKKNRFALLVSSFGRGRGRFQGQSDVLLNPFVELVELYLLSPVLFRILGSLKHFLQAFALKCIHEKLRLIEYLCNDTQLEIISLSIQ